MLLNGQIKHLSSIHSRKTQVDYNALITSYNYNKSYEKVIEI